MTNEVTRRPMDPVRLQVQRFPGNASVVHVGGPLLSDTTAPMRHVLDAELLRGPESLAVNLAGVTDIDSAGIDALTAAATQAGESDIGFCLVGAHRGPVASALSAARLTELFEIVPTLDDIATPIPRPWPDSPLL
ncbi:STAS domain-containing protein [Mycolicibacterium doricum]|nr:STAS domain-containing protein [Mycolicibacterium doricum]